jgi:hypothetical protein
MEIRYYIDPETDQPHIYGHGVSEDEIETVLIRPGEDRPGYDDSRVAIGISDGGRYLKIVYVPDADDESVFVITAYELKGKALAAYRRRMRRRRRR